MTNQFEVDFYENFYRLKRYLENRSLVLGGATGSGGGSGGPPGGFIGWLPQTRVAYDLSELATDYTPPSGASLVDNLNHIRYSILTLSGAIGNLTEIELNDITVLNDIEIFNFEGHVDVVDEGSKKATITILSEVDYSTTNISNPPTDSELDSEFGTPSSVGEGYTVLINDAGSGSNAYVAYSDGTNWWYQELTKAI